MSDDEFYAEASYPVCQVYSEEDAFTSFVQVCRLFGVAWFVRGVFVYLVYICMPTNLLQAMLALFALMSLWIKRMQEKPKRAFLTWFLDVSKQGVGACYAHILNMCISAVIAGNVRGGQTLEDECAWYAINYVIDTTLGLLITIVFLDWLERLANHFDWVSLKNSGVYVGRVGVLHWFWQLAAWIAILSLVKIIICIFMWLFSSPLAYAGAILFAPLQSNIRFELLFVMIFFPGVLNVVYFWITDSYLKHAAHDEEEHENSAEPDTSYFQMGEVVNGGKQSSSSGNGALV